MPYMGIKKAAGAAVASPYLLPVKARNAGCTVFVKCAKGGVPDMTITLNALSKNGTRVQMWTYTGAGVEVTVNVTSPVYKIEAVVTAIAADSFDIEADWVE